MNEATLVLMLDDLLPGGNGFPAASTVGLAGRIGQRAEWTVATDAVLTALPAAFLTVPSAKRQEILRLVETSDPDQFGLMIVAAYSGYYTHPTVRAVIAERTGYPATPPQPAGHRLPPFDSAALARARRNPVSYRKGSVTLTGAEFQPRQR
jgi:hypothetical protein